MDMLNQATAMKDPICTEEKMEEMIDELLERGVVKHSHSLWASPVVPVAKDGTMRFCVDYCWLNSITKLDTIPLPRMTTDWIY